MSPMAAIPDEVHIFHHKRGPLGSRAKVNESLINPDGSRSWIEHKAGRNIDLAILPLSQFSDEVVINPFDLELSNVDIVPVPGLPVAIIAFPMFEWFRTLFVWCLMKNIRVLPS